MAQKIADQVARETPLSPTAMAQQLAAVYRDYSRTATLAGADMTAGGNVSLLEDAFLVEDSSVQVTRLAAGLCAYWATCGVPGMPAHGGISVQSVVITTAGHVAAMEAAIRALVTDEEVPDAFAAFGHVGMGDQRFATHVTLLGMERTRLRAILADASRLQGLLANLA